MSPSGRQMRPAGPLAATSARTGRGALDLDQVADGGGEAGDQQVQAEQLGHATELVGAHGGAGAVAQVGGEEGHPQTPP